MGEIRFNTAPSSLFNVAVNGASGQIEERDKLVAQGRLIMYEANGREKSRIRANAGQHTSFESRLPEGSDYRAMSEKFRERLVLYCAKIAKNANGERAPENYEEFLRFQRDFYNDKAFFRALAGVMRDIIRPMLPYVISNAVGELGQMVEVGFGETYEITVGSNDIMIFSDSAWGASRSVPEEDLYSYPITLNPSMTSAKWNTSWRQLIANNGGDIGMWMNSLVAGMYSKIMAMWGQALVSASTNTFYTPSYLQNTTFNTDNFVTIAKKVGEVNHVDRSRLICYGDWLALSHIMPSGTSQDAALTYGLGTEWNSNGFLGTTMGVPCVMFENVLVPGTQNTTGTNVLPTDQIWIAASRANGTAPLYIGIESGTPIQLDLDPTFTADNSIGVNLSVALDVKAVFGTKVGTITNV